MAKKDKPGLDAGVGEDPDNHPVLVLAVVREVTRANAETLRNLAEVAARNPGITGQRALLDAAKMLEASAEMFSHKLRQ